MFLPSSAALGVRHLFQVRVHGVMYRERGLWLLWSVVRAQTKIQAAWLKVGAGQGWCPSYRMSSSLPLCSQGMGLWLGSTWGFVPGWGSPRDRRYRGNHAYPPTHTLQRSLGTEDQAGTLQPPPSASLPFELSHCVTWGRLLDFSDLPLFLQNEINGKPTDQMDGEIT